MVSPFWLLTAVAAGDSFIAVKLRLGYTLILSLLTFLLYTTYESMCCYMKLALFLALNEFNRRGCAFWFVLAVL